jgi:hypothetical protein
MDAAVSGGVAGSGEVPLLAVLVGRGVDRTRIRRAGVPVYSTPEDALRALGHASRYHAWRSTPVGALARTDHDARDTTRKLAASLETGWQEPGTIRQLLDSYGVRAPVGQLCTGDLQVRAAASGIDGTIVMKVADPAVVHRTELHLVETNLDGVEAAAACYQGFVHALQVPDPPVLVQPKVSGTEIAVGVVRDERFGPLVMVAAGGTGVDLWNDRVFLLPPINDLEVGRALRQLRVWPLLEGYRGQAGADVEGLLRLIGGVGSLAVDLPELAELDLNPVIVTADGVACVDAKMRLAAQPVITDDPAAPHLRSPS